MRPKRLASQPSTFQDPVPESSHGTDSESLKDYLDPLPARTAALALDKLRFVERREYSIACNWKVYVDNFLDGGYHVNTIHPGLAGVLDYAQDRTAIAGNTSVQSSPLRPPDPSQENASAGKVRTGENAYYWWVFPNFMINIYGGAMDTNLVLPLGPDRCRVIFDFYFARTEGPEAERFIADSIALCTRSSWKTSRFARTCRRDWLADRTPQAASAYAARSRAIISIACSPAVCKGKLKENFMGKLKGKVTLITGGSRGIGKGIARAFAAERASLILTARGVEELQRTTDELTGQGTTVLALPADLADEKQVMGIFAKIMDRFGRLDILVNNAGAFDGAPLDEMLTATWDKVLSINLRAPFLCMREAMKMMKRQGGGRIINIGSISAQRVRPQSAAYSTSKHGLWGLTQVTALEGRDHGISCGCLHPGNVVIDAAAIRAKRKIRSP